MGTKAKLIQPIATRCVRAARSGRIEHDPRRTRRVVAQAAGHKRSDKSKAKRGVKHGEWSDCRIVPKKGGENRSAARRRQPGVGLGKATDKGRKKEPEGQKSKVKQEESSLREKPEPDWPRRLADWTNPEGARKAHSLVDKVTCSIHSFLTTEQMLTIVKAGCGKSARPVWEADGGQRRKVRLLRPDSCDAPECAERTIHSGQSGPVT